MVTRRTIQRIREKIRRQQYDMTSHALEEMAEDKLDIVDIEHAVLSGKVVHSEQDGARGVKHVIHGEATDPTVPVGVVGRLTSSDRFLIITVYEISD